MLQIPMLFSKLNVQLLVVPNCVPGPWPGPLPKLPLCGTDLVAGLPEKFLSPSLAVFSLLFKHSVFLYNVLKDL